MSEQPIKSEAVEWNEEAARLLSRAIHNCDIDDLRIQVENGAALFKLSVGDELAGYYILRIDNLTHWDEAVYVAGAGASTLYDLPKLSIALAQQQVHGCKFLRIHTARAGVVKKMLQMGFKAQEFVLMKELN